MLAVRAAERAQKRDFIFLFFSMIQIFVLSLQGPGSLLMNFSHIETIAAISNIIYVFGAALHKRWCWYFAFVGSLLYVFVFAQHTLYLEACLQLFYMVVAVQGWYLWSFSREKVFGIAQLSVKQSISHLCIILPSALSVGWLFLRFSDASQPFLDASLSIFSIYATWLAVKKYLQNWLLWILIDSISVAWFFSRQMYPTALLFLAYVVMAVAGYVFWKRELIPPKDNS
jgi:nicotinamide mononucleotide transporter